MADLLIATTNPGKRREYAALFGGLPLNLLTLADVGITDDVEETGATFAENAELKARYYAERSGLPTLADDSGLEVVALNGEPGIRSARYAGPHASEAERNALLLQRLADVPFEQRQARFVCVIALAWPDGRLEFAEGALEGLIAFEPRGENGFGYDPLFYLPEAQQTVAELPAAEKNAISHRARAAAAVRPILERWLADA